MKRGPIEVPTPDRIAEEPLRPLLTTIRTGSMSMLEALYAECPDAFPGMADEACDPEELVLRTTHLLAQATEGMLEAIELHEEALDMLHALRHSQDLDF